MTSINLVRDYRFLIISLKIDVYKLNYFWYTRVWYYRAHASQLDFLNKQSHPRRTWDLWPRVYDKANPNIPGLFLFGHYLESFFEKRSKWITQIQTQHIWFSSSRFFQWWSRICRSPSGSFGSWLFACVTGGPIQLYYSSFVVSKTHISVAA